MTENHPKEHDGKVVSVVVDKLTTTCSEGKQHYYTLTGDTQVTCDGKPSKAADLKAGTNVRVTPRLDDKSKAASVDSGKHITGPAIKA